MSKYYCLVASLRDYAPDGAEKDFDALAIREYVDESLEPRDRQALRLLYTYYDIENLCGVTMHGRRWSALGYYTAEQLEEEIKKPDLLPDYLARVIEAYNHPESYDDDEVDLCLRMERSLYAAYYKETARSDCRFLREWSAFDRTLRNVCAASAALKAGREPEHVLVGDDQVTAALARNTTADFGLKNEVEWIDAAAAILNEETDMQERERRLDAMRWSMADGLTEFDYFDLNNVLAYLVKVNMVHRWRSLDRKVGQEMFNHLLSTLSGPRLLERIEKEEENKRIGN